MWTMYDNSATDVLRCGSVCPRSKPARGMRMPPGIACCPVGVGSGRRLGYCRDCWDRCRRCEGALPVLRALPAMAPRPEPVEPPHLRTLL